MVKRTVVAFATFILALYGAENGARATDDFLLSEGGSLQGVPAVAYDSNHDRFFATWSDFRNRQVSGPDIFGRILDAAGRPVTGDIPISMASKGQGFSAVAFDPTKDRYLVVWTDWRSAISVDSDIYGQFVNADGSLHGGDFAITRRRVSQKYPGVAFDPIQRRFLVVWADGRHARVEKIYAQFIGSEGELSGDEFVLSTAGGDQDRPTVRFDAKRGRFFVAWRDSQTEGKAIQGIFVGSEPVAQGPSFLIAFEKDGCLPPSLYAADFAENEDLLLVVWTSRRDYDKQGLDVYGAIVSSVDGTLRGLAFPIAATTDYQEAASVAFDPNGDRFLVVWYDLRRDPTGVDMDIYGRYVSTDGSMSEEFLVSDPQAPGLRRFPTLSFSPERDKFFVLWEDGRERATLSRRIYGSIL